MEYLGDFLRLFLFRDGFEAEMGGIGHRCTLFIRRHICGRAKRSAGIEHYTAAVKHSPGFRVEHAAAAPTWFRFVIRSHISGIIDAESQYLPARMFSQARQKESGQFTEYIWRDP